MEQEEPLLVGDYVIVQDRDLYRFSTDSIRLARFLKAKKGEMVADFCAGSGIVGLHFYAENAGVRSVVLFEMQPSLAKMSERTIARNGLESVFRVENVRLQEIPPRYESAFSLILCNPPYGREGDGCRGGELSPRELAHAASRCLKPKGRLAAVYRCDRTAEAVCALKAEGLEPKTLQFIAGKAGKKPYAVLIAAVKGGRAGTEVLPTLVNGE